MKDSVSFALYGVTERDADEFVFQVFENLSDLREFARDLPGTYDEVLLIGVDYNELTIIRTKRMTTKIND